MTTYGIIYLDNAATTAIHPKVARVRDVVDGIFGNTGTMYREGQRAREVIEDARARIARHLGISADLAKSRVFFTSGATEGNNWCIKGAVEAWWNRQRDETFRAMKYGESPARLRKPRIVTDLGEHHSVLNVVQTLAQHGECTAHYWSLDPKTGAVDAKKVLESVSEDTLLVSVMMINNETGVLNPVEEIGAGIRKYNNEHGCHVLFHVDATQAIGKMAVDVNEIGCQMLTASGHKFHAGKGRGFVYIDPYAEIANLLEGGGQQMGRRAGTEDTTAAACLAEALDIEWETNKWGQIDSYTRETMKMLSEIEGAHFNGISCPRSGIISVWFDGVESEELLALLERNGVICSAGSACTTGEPTPSHVLTVMNAEAGSLKGTIRISVGTLNTMSELEKACEEIKMCVAILRGE